jgi:tyrosine-protein kinase Etk/Wzc
MEQKDSLLGVLGTLIRNRKFLLRFVGIVGVLTAAASFLMPNYYASTASFYAASPDLANPELMFGYTANVTRYYGDEHDLDRLMTIAESNELLDFMVKKFDLYEHYDIDSTEPKAPYKLREHFRELYTISKTKADAIELEIEDTDKQFAQLMVNAAMQKINDVASRITRESQGKIIQSFETNMTEKRLLLDKYGDSLTILRKKSGIIDPVSQGEILSERVAESESEMTRLRVRLGELESNPLIPRDTIAYLKADLKAASTEYSELTDMNSVKGLNVRKFNEGVSKISEFQDLHFQARKQLSYDLERYNQIKAAYKTNIPAIHIIQIGELPVVKSRPKRSILVLGAMLAAFVFGLLALLVAEHYRDVKWSDLEKM